MATRVRFAPSPTGYLHVGGARTALFNWLYARRMGGVFVLRIEDTDIERSSWAMVAGIVEGMRWLGLDWDEGPDVGGPHAPYFQSQRLDRYRAAAERLVGEGHAYYCYCPPELLKEKREAADRAGAAWKYDRTCAALPAEVIAKREATGATRAIRFRVPPGETVFNDLVHGPIAFEHANLEDFVILRSDFHPTYHLSVVIDDLDMRITEVIRGDDHVSNTPKQILLYRALGSEPPRFAHVPLILGRDKQRLSKRHGATSVMEYARQGYLPEAMLNFLALLGWAPGTDEEVFSRAALIQRFSLDGISRSNAVFNLDKLDWFNSEHLRRMDGDELAARVARELEARGLWRQAYLESERDWYGRVLELLRPRARRLADFAEDGRAFFAAEVDYDPAAVARHLGVDGLAAHIEALAGAWARLPAWTAEATETALRSTAAEREITAGVLIHATRVAITGKAVGASLFDIVALAGRERTLIRLDRLRRFLVLR